jgi:hypothetical protein
MRSIAGLSEELLHHEYRVSERRAERVFRPLIVWFSYAFYQAMANPRDICALAIPSGVYSFALLERRY